MLYLVTGSNGAGKTLFTLRWARDLQLKFQKEGIDRTVYYDGFDIDPRIEEEFGWKPCDPMKWMDLPDNSIVIVDEAQRIFPVRSAGSDTPEHEDQIAVSHRKRGFDFFIVSQHPSNISAFLRRLVGSGWHKHLKRMFGMEKVNCLTFNYAETSCEKPSAKQNAYQQEKLKFPKEVYSWYKSAELHTAKGGLPKLYYLVIIGAVVAVLLVVFVYYFMMSRTPEPEKKPEAAPSFAVSERFKPAYNENREKDSLSTEDYIKAHIPRIKGFPHSAPRYDEVTKPVTAPYPAACIKFEGKGCRCFSQQGTRIMMDEPTCENIVKEGYFVDWDTKPQRNNEREMI